MPSPTDFPTPGKILSVTADGVVFHVRGTNYELNLRTPAGAYTGPVGSPVHALIRGVGRKVWTVPSGGNFISPIMGPPRIVQGRVKHFDEKHVVVHGGATFIIELPADDAAIDLPNGAMAVGTMVNVTVLPGATLEVVGAPVAS